MKQIQSFFESLAIDATERFVHSENITNELKDDGTPITNIDKGINACVLLGLSKDGRSVCGVCYMPATEELYSASKGNGAVKIVNGSRKIIKTSGQDTHRLVVGRYNVVDDLKRILSKEGKSLKNVQFGGSFGVKACWVAEGKFDEYIYIYQFRFKQKSSCKFVGFLCSRCNS